jgi:hypothetical protein
VGRLPSDRSDDTRHRRVATGSIVSIQMNFLAAHESIR